MKHYIERTSVGFIVISEIGILKQTSRYVYKTIDSAQKELERLEKYEENKTKVIELFTTTRDNSTRAIAHKLNLKIDHVTKIIDNYLLMKKKSYL